MVPVRSYCSVGGVPIERLIKPDRLNAIEDRVRKAGGEIVNLLKTGSAFYSPAGAAVQMAEAFLRDQHRILPCAAYLEGEYGVRGVYVGVPVQIGAGGVEKVIEIALSEDEQRQFGVSVSHVEELVQAMDRVLTAGG
jgi:malate dehydrogenase